MKKFFIGFLFSAIISSLFFAGLYFLIRFMEYLIESGLDKNLVAWGTILFVCSCVGGISYAAQRD